MQKNYKDVFTVELVQNDIKLWHVTYKGAEGTIYQNEIFKYRSHQ